MSSESIVVNYAKVKAKSVDVERDIISHNNDGSTSTTLRFTNTNTNDRILTIPALNANASVMTSESAVAPDKLNINGATAETSPASTDEFIFYDASASANRKIPFSNLKSAIDTTLDVNSLTEQTVAGVATANDMMVVYDASANDNKKLSVDTLKQINYAGVSGHASISSAGALSLNGNNIQGMHPGGTASSTKLLVVDGTAVKNLTIGNISSTVLDSRGGVGGQIEVYTANGVFEPISMGGDARLSNAAILTLEDKPTAKKTAEADKFLQCDASKDIDGVNALGVASITASADIAAANSTVSGEFRLGTNKWKMAQSGNNLQFLEYNGSAWVVKFQIEGAGQS